MITNTTDLQKALFAELEALQDEKRYTDSTGSFDKEKAEHAMKRAEAVCNTASKIIDVQRLQLDVVKTAYAAGYAVNMPASLGLALNKEESK